MEPEIKPEQPVLLEPPLPIMTFPGKIELVRTRDEAEAAISELSVADRIGFDTETKPSFFPGESYPISILQLATEETAYIFQLRKSGFPDSLVALLSTAEVLKIGVGIDVDIRKLKDIRGFEPRGFVDLSRLAILSGLTRSGLKFLVQHFLNSRIIKSSQTSDWSRSTLTPKQLLYAATDAWVCLRLYPFF